MAIIGYKNDWMTYKWHTLLVKHGLFCDVAYQISRGDPPVHIFLNIIHQKLFIPDLLPMSMSLMNWTIWHSHMFIWSTSPCTLKSGNFRTRLNFVLITDYENWTNMYEIFPIQTPPSLFDATRLNLLSTLVFVQAKFCRCGQSQENLTTQIFNPWILFYTKISWLTLYHRNIL